MTAGIITVVVVWMALKAAILYAALVVAGRCDDMEEKYWKFRNMDYEQD